MLKCCITGCGLSPGPDVFLEQVTSRMITQWAQQQHLHSSLSCKPAATAANFRQRSSPLTHGLDVIGVALRGEWHTPQYKGNQKLSILPNILIDICRYKKVDNTKNEWSNGPVPVDFNDVLISIMCGKILLVCGTLVPVVTAAPDRVHWVMALIIFY